MNCVGLLTRGKRCDRLKTLSLSFWTVVRVLRVRVIGTIALSRF